MSPSIGLVSLLAAVLSAMGCSLWARWMRQHRSGQPIREEGPARHMAKAGTPTMGGVVVLALWVVSSVLLSLWIPLGQAGTFVVASGLAMGAIGAIDDVLKLRRQRSLGLSGWQKIGLTAATALGLFFAAPDSVAATLQVPFSGITVAAPPWALALLTVVVFLAATNAVNFTDGLDGLAAGVVLIILGGFIALSHDRASCAVLVPLAGALAGFLWMNTHPARLIMGDAGSFGLGGVLAAVALSRGTAFVLPLLAGVPVLEVLSVLLQVASLRLLGRRLFRMSPLHHHLEVCPTGSPKPHLLPAGQWPEEKVVVRLWLIQAAFVTVALLAS